MDQKQKKTILLFIDWYLPGFKAGGPIRSMANMVQHLGKEFDFKIITRDTDYTSTEAYPGIISNAWNEGPFGEKVFYFSETQLNRKNLRKVIRETPYDIAYINGVYSWNFSILPLILCRKEQQKKIIVATRGMLAESAIEVKSSKKKLFLNLAKFSGIYKNVQFHVTNAAEEQDVYRSIGKQARVFIADNLPVPMVPSAVIKPNKQKGHLHLVNIARIAPEKNLAFALECLKNISQGEIVFDVYGPAYDSNYEQACRNIAADLPKNISVNFSGSLSPDKIPDVLQQADLMFMPTRGENFGHIILESLQHGTPTLVSDQTPFTGCDGVEALPLNQPKSFEESLLRWLMMDQSEYTAAAEKTKVTAALKNNTSPLLERYRNLFA